MLVNVDCQETVRPISVQSRLADVAWPLRNSEWALPFSQGAICLMAGSLRRYLRDKIKDFK